MSQGSFCTLPSRPWLGPSEGLFGTLAAKARGQKGCFSIGFYCFSAQGATSQHRFFEYSFFCSRQSVCEGGGEGQTPQHRFLSYVLSVLATFDTLESFRWRPPWKKGGQKGGKINCSPLRASQLVLPTEGKEAI